MRYVTVSQEFNISMLFKDIVGQDNIKAKLLQGIKENRISHAQMFLGPEGSGNLPMAMAYAQYINCSSKQEADSCGHCPSCKKNDRLVHPDIHFSFPIAKTAKTNSETAKTRDPVSDNFIEEWRQAFISNPYLSLNQWLNILGLENKQAFIYTRESDEIIKKLSLKPFESDYKTLIMWMPEKMNDQASNKLLKLIEEPPANTLFLLVAENQDQILKTMLSRTQIIHFPKIGSTKLFDTIKSNYGLKDQEIWDVVKLANGNYTKARELIESSDEIELFFNTFTSLMRLAYTGKIIDLIILVDKISGFGRERQKNFLVYCNRLVRENFISNFNNNDIVFMTMDEKDFSKKFSPYIHTRNVHAIADELQKAHYQVQRNVNARLIFMDLGLRLNKLLKI